MIDSEQGVLYYYDYIKNDFISKKFEDYLKEILWDVTNKIKSEIDFSRIKLNNTERTKYWEEILFSLDKIKETREVIIKKISNY